MFNAIRVLSYLVRAGESPYFCAYVFTVCKLWRQIEFIGGCSCYNMTPQKNICILIIEYIFYSLYYDHTKVLILFGHF